MASAQCAVRALTGFPFCGLHAQNEIYLHIDQPTVHVDSVVTGTVQVVGEYAHEVVAEVILEGIEYCVVAMSKEETAGRRLSKDYLKEHTTEARVFLKKEMTVHDAEHPSLFRFALPKDIPGTLRCVLGESNPILPSQCQIKYTVTARILNQGAKQEIEKSVVVIPRKESEFPVDRGIQVSSAKSALDVLNRNIMSCGGGAAAAMQCDKLVVPDGVQLFPASTEDEILAEENSGDLASDTFMELASSKHIRLEASRSSLCLTAGTPLEVSVTDWFRQLKPGSWMVRLMEEVNWRAQGRKEKSRQIWDLHANRQELPATLRRSFAGSIASVRHELIVYLMDDATKEVLASTEIIPVLIVGNARGLDA